MRETEANNYLKATLALSIALALGLSVALAPQQAAADSISPGVTDTGAVYSKEKPNTSYFGTGIGGRLAEASQLRFKGERMLDDGHFDDAVNVLGKAVQLEPGYPEGHVLLARALTGKLKTLKPEEFDWKLHARCMAEWKMLAIHDADLTEQLEAKSNMALLKRYAKAMKRREQDKDSDKDGDRKSSVAGRGIFKIFHLL